MIATDAASLHALVGSLQQASASAEAHTGLGLELAGTSELVATLGHELGLVEQRLTQLADALAEFARESAEVAIELERLRQRLAPHGLVVDGRLVVATPGVSRTDPQMRQQLQQEAQAEVDGLASSQERLGGRLAEACLQVRDSLAAVAERARAASA